MPGEIPNVTSNRPVTGAAAAPARTPEQQEAELAGAIDSRFSASAVDRLVSDGLVRSSSLKGRSIHALVGEGPARHTLARLGGGLDSPARSGQGNRPAVSAGGTLAGAGETLQALFSAVQQGPERTQGEGTDNPTYPGRDEAHPYEVPVGNQGAAKQSLPIYDANLDSTYSQVSARPNDGTRESIDGSAYAKRPLPPIPEEGTDNPTYQNSDEGRPYETPVSGGSDNAIYHAQEDAQPYEAPVPGGSDNPIYQAQDDARPYEAPVAGGSDNPIYQAQDDARPYEAPVAGGSDNPTYQGSEGVRPHETPSGGGTAPPEGPPGDYELPVSQQAGKPQNLPHYDANLDSEYSQVSNQPNEGIYEPIDESAHRRPSSAYANRPLPPPPLPSQGGQDPIYEHLDEVSPRQAPVATQDAQGDDGGAQGTQRLGASRVRTLFRNALGGGSH